MKNYDKKVKQTRILLSDYQFVKAVAQRDNVSMAEALHRLIVRARTPYNYDWAEGNKAQRVT
jgi:hypothetical protein